MSAQGGMFFLPLIPLLQYRCKSTRSLGLGFFIPLLLFFCNLFKFAVKRGNYPELDSDTHESDCTCETKLDLHRLGNRKYDAVIGKLWKEGPET
jgi:hypothetical protein